jgi:hypothetical protein
VLISEQHDLLSAGEELKNILPVTAELTEVV